MGDTIIAGISRAALVGGAVDQIGRCVVADAGLAVGILVKY